MNFDIKNMTKKQAFFAFWKFEKTTELPRGLQPIDICFWLDIFSRDLLDVQLEHKKNFKQYHKSSLLYMTQKLLAGACFY